MRIIVTGSRDWDDYTQIHRVLEAFGSGAYVDPSHNRVSHDTVTVIHGAARGADRMAGLAAQRLGYEIIAVPAAWGTYGKRAGSIRNQKMIDMGADLVVAFPRPESVGTYDCIRRAERAGITVVRGDQMIFPGD